MNSVLPIGIIFFSGGGSILALSSAGRGGGPPVHYTQAWARTGSVPPVLGVERGGERDLFVGSFYA